jgi:hypothetical protein
MANCLATSLGSGGHCAATLLNETKELFDEYIKRDVSIR